MNIRLQLSIWLLLISISGLSFAADTSAPELLSWEIISSDTINVDNGAGVVSVKFRIADESDFEEPRLYADLKSHLCS